MNSHGMVPYKVFYFLCGSDIKDGQQHRTLSDRDISNFNNKILKIPKG
jgi:hypothetical protein